MKLVQILFILLISFNMCCGFDCSFSQKENEKTCFGDATLCAVENLLYNTPKILESLEPLLTNLSEQKQSLCSCFQNVAIKAKTSSCSEISKDQNYISLQAILESEDEKSMKLFL